MCSFFLSPLNLTKIKIIKIIQKFLFNLGAAFLFWWLWSLPNPFIINFIFFFFLFGSFLSIINAYHGYGMYRICKKCEYSLEWDKCPGFVKYNEYIEKNNLPNLFKYQNKEKDEF
ncbi:MAG: hypothetical protein ACTSRI_18145 [Promethearchaeota archaeon]